MTDCVLTLQSYRETLPIIFSKNVFRSREYFGTACGLLDKPENMCPHEIFNLRSIIPSEWLTCVRSVSCKWHFPTFATEVRNPWESNDLARTLLENLKITFPGIKRISFKIRTYHGQNTDLVRTEVLTPMVELLKHYDIADIVLDVIQEIYDRIKQMSQQSGYLPPPTQSKGECWWPVERSSGSLGYLIVR